jgi:hypothetical protein
MTINNPILTLLEDGLKSVSKAQAEMTLGDRQTYLGMSDLALGLSCPRAVLAGKLSPEDPNLSLSRLLTLERGHWLEHGVERALKSTGTSVLSQLEISAYSPKAPIKAHLDLAIIDQASNSVTVLELKSLAKIRDEVSEIHEAQLLGQIGLLNQFWNEPVFRLDGQGPFSFSELADKFLALKFPSKPAIEGYVLTISPNAARAFGPYEPDSDRLDTILRKGSELWNQLVDLREGRVSLGQIAFRKEFSPLCDYCRFNRDCPKFAGEVNQNLESELTSLADLKSQKSRLEEEIQERESQLKAIACLMDKKGQWITSGGYRFKVSEQKGRSSLDQDLLRLNLVNSAGMDETTVLRVTESSLKTGRPFERFYLSQVH